MTTPTPGNGASGSDPRFPYGNGAGPSPSDVAAQGGHPSAQPTQQLPGQPTAANQHPTVQQTLPLPVQPVPAQPVPGQPAQPGQPVGQQPMPQGGQSVPAQQPLPTRQAPQQQGAWQVTMPSTYGGPTPRSPQPSGPEPFYKRTWFILTALIGSLLLVVSLVGVGVSSLFGGTDDPLTSPTTSPSTGPTPSPGPTTDPFGSQDPVDPFGTTDPTDPYGDGDDWDFDPYGTKDVDPGGAGLAGEVNLNQPIAMEGAEFVVTKVEVVDRIDAKDDFDTAIAKSGKKYMIVDLTVTDQGSKYGVMVFASDYRLIAADGTQYSEDDDARWALKSNDQSVPYDIPGKGQSISGRIAFEVPADASDPATYTLYVPDGEFGRTHALVKLVG